MTAVDSRALLNDIEGHLLIAAAREEGRRAATDVCAQLQWLTDAQRAELEGRLEAQYLNLARTSWQRTADRAREVRAEYEQTYRGLRRRLLAGWLLACAATTGALLLLL
ncbi:hypothetical protein ABZT03_25955 [Streptomyces sp. NPDC005574]|uniref:hypothetical protein n=1 Tax=Streptomyces sp. NPDC005574 TaxID=3156891 RepID=UPI0033BE4ED6